ncbi:hypothetical protein TNCV_1940391 [Trichonephila clavipes]|nr:hypothetical protein TNCV_1940391 [Trichonephila clavipes]
MILLKRKELLISEKESLSEPTCDPSQKLSAFSEPYEFFSNKKLNLLQLVATANRIALSTRIPLSPELAGPIQQLTASSSAILINHHPDSINESGVTSTRCYPNRQDCRSRLLHQPLPCSPPPP